MEIDHARYINHHVSICTWDIWCIYVRIIYNYWIRWIVIFNSRNNINMGYKYMGYDKIIIL